MSEQTQQEKPPLVPQALGAAAIRIGVVIIVAFVAWGCTSMLLLREGGPKSAGLEVPEPQCNWRNSLGMEFVPVPKTTVLFSKWETRVQDYQAFVEATGPRVWDYPGFDQGSKEPAVNVSRDDAHAFCRWLTEQERKKGVLHPEQSYRLPTDAEWSAAVGLTNEVGTTPIERSRKGPKVYPWGPEWPPPRNVANLLTPPRNVANLRTELNVDGFDRTSPVGAFPPNTYGIYDLAGNVSELCEDYCNGTPCGYVVRGSGWSSGMEWTITSSFRGLYMRSSQHDWTTGFRCVLSFGDQAEAGLK